MKKNIYVVSHFEGAAHLFVHAVMIECHEERIDDDAQRDKEFNECVINEKADEPLEADPVRRAVPHTANVQIFEREGQQSFLDFGTFVLVIHRICRRQTLKIEREKKLRSFIHRNTAHVNEHTERERDQKLQDSREWTRCSRCSRCSPWWCRTMRSGPMSCIAMASKSSSTGWIK